MKDGVLYSRSGNLSLHVRKVDLLCVAAALAVLTSVFLSDPP